MLRLSQADQRRFASVLELLISPLRYENHMAWRRDVCRAMKALLGADQATFVFDLPDHEAFFSEEIDLASLQAYPASINPLSEQWDLSERHAALGAYNRELLWGEHLPELLHSAYYNEYIRPNRGFDAIGLCDAPDGHPVIGRMPNIILHRHREGGPTFGERGLAYLRMLLPAFRASARLLHSVQGNGYQLIALLDGTGHAAYAVDHSGKRHRTAAFEDLMATDPERKFVIEECDRMGAAALALATRRPSVEVAESSLRCERDLRTSRGTYRVRVSLVPHPISKAHPCAIVTVELPREAVRPTPSVLIERFGLTGREVEVAYLLADRRRQGEVAAALGVSIHTARRHAESVMRKLGVSAREDVAARLVAQ